MKKILRNSGMAFALLAMLFVCGCSEENEGGTPATPGNGDSALFEEGQDIFFAEAYDISTSSASIRVERLKTTLSYFYGVIDKEYINQYYYEDLQTYVNEQILLEKESNGGTLSGDVLYRDKITDESWDGFFLGNSDYIIWVVGLTSGGTVTTEIHTFEFTTLPVTPSENKFEVSVINGNISIKPELDEPYMWLVFDDSVNDFGLTPSKDFTPDEVALIAWFTYGPGIVTMTTATTFDYGGYLTHGLPYVLWVFGWDGGITTPLNTTAFVYEDEDLVKYATLDHDVDWTVPAGATARFTDWGNFVHNETGIDYNVRNWMILLEVEISSEGDGDEKVTRNEFLVGEFYTSLLTKSPVGRYEVATAYKFQDGDMLSGKVHPGTYDLSGLWYGVGDRSMPWLEGSVLSPAQTGWLEVSKSGSDYVVECEFTDLNGNKVSAHYTGPMTIRDFSNR